MGLHINWQSLVKLNFKRLFKTLTGKQANFLLVIAKLLREILSLYKQDPLEQLERLCIKYAANQNNYENLLQVYKY